MSHEPVVSWRGRRLAALTANESLPEEEEAELDAPALLVSGSMLAVMSEEGGAVGGAAGDKKEGLVLTSVAPLSASCRHKLTTHWTKDRKSRQPMRGLACD